MMKPISTLGQLEARTANLRRLEGDLTAAGQETSTLRPSDLAASLGGRTDALIALRNKASANEVFKDSIAVFEGRADVMSNALQSVEGAMVTLQSAITVNVPDAGQSVGAVAVAAESALSTLVSALNSSFNGRFLFSGAAVDQSSLGAPGTNSPVTGISPDQVIAQVLDGTAYPVVQPPAFAGFTAGEAATAITRITEVFDGTNAVAGPPLDDFSFERTMYGGDLTGLPVTVRLDDGPGRDYGMTAADPSVRDLIQGAMMLTSVDLVEMAGTEAYAPYVTEALARVSAGLDGLRAQGARLGAVQQEVEVRKEALTAEFTLLNEQINALEQADPIEAQTRFSAIEKQLEAAYAATVRVTRLRLSNYL